ncbi:hypothetical protein EP607_03675 [Campylobacter upsaliensis]|nr:hypothetical protein [Campylobacter upsaliensis]
MQKSEFENPKYKKLVRAGVKSAITTSQGAKQKLTEAISLTTDKSITQGLFKSKEAREFLELVEGFHKLYKNNALIAKNFTQGTASVLNTSIATTAEGAIKQKVVRGAFDPTFRLLPDKIYLGFFLSKFKARR